MTQRRRFGRVRKLPSGRWQARYLGPDGVDYPAPATFGTKTSAERWLVKIESEIREDHWLSPDLGRVMFSDYSRAWIKERPNLRPDTMQVYGYLLARHIEPAFGARAVASIREPHVRRWRGDLLAAQVSPTSVAKSYRLLKAILNTAVDDGILARNPCRIRGAAQDRSPERPVLSPRQVVGLVELVDARYQAVILLATFGSLRWGELAALRRSDIDPESGNVRVQRSLMELPGGGYQFGPPKSAAGRRTVVLPTFVRPAIARHVKLFTATDDDALIFTAPTGGPLRHSNFRRRVWVPALARAELTGLHFHDLRHSGNVMAASAGATLRDLMDRMGHSSPRAALIYLHGSDARQRAIAEDLDKLVTSELRPRRSRSGTPRARRPRSGE